MTVTNALQNQAGIQYSSVQDKSEADPRDSLLNTIIVGTFKRGRLDKPFKVTKQNYRAKLGHDPENLQYQAIEDLFSAGIPFVWVQRVGNTSKKLDWNFQCDGATTSARFVVCVRSDIHLSDPEQESWEVISKAKIGVNGHFYENLDDFFNNVGDLDSWADLVYSDEVTPPNYNAIGEIGFENLGVNNQRIVMDISKDNPNSDYIIVQSYHDNQAYYQDEDRRILSVCLAPNPESEPQPEVPQPIQCTPTVIPMNKDLMRVDDLVIRYSFNGGEIYTYREPTSAAATVHHVLVNVLYYSPSLLSQKAIGNFYADVARHFFINYDYPIQGAPAGSYGEPMTMEFWVTPGVNNCLVTKAFGGDFVLRSCGTQFWRENNTISDIADS